jgi:SAM-dependent methyltransferase
MGEQSLYRELAPYYDRVYDWKDYDADIERLLAIIHDRKSSPGNRLLDIGCGTGAHIARLVDNFDCTGIDINEDMLKVAREKVPTASFMKGDMATFDLDMKFDIIISMFGTIGYVSSLDMIQRVVDNIEAHLATGGVAVLEPFLLKDDYIPGHVAMSSYEDDDIKISRVSTSTLDGNLCTFSFHYLIGQRGKGVEYTLDTHTLWLFKIEELMTAMDNVGLNTKFDPVGFGQKRGALISTKRA